MAYSELAEDVPRMAAPNPREMGEATSQLGILESLVEEVDGGIKTLAHLSESIFRPVYTAEGELKSMKDAIEEASPVAARIRGVNSRLRRIIEMLTELQGRVDL